MCLSSVRALLSNQVRAFIISKLEGSTDLNNRAISPDSPGGQSQLCDFEQMILPCCASVSPSTMLFNAPDTATDVFFPKTAHGAGVVMEQAGLSFAQDPTWPPSFAETYQQLQDFQSWPDQDIISRVNALANATVVSPSLETGNSMALWVNSLHLVFLTCRETPVLNIYRNPVCSCSCFKTPSCDGFDPLRRLWRCPAVAPGEAPHVSCFSTHSFSQAPCPKPPGSCPWTKLLASWVSWKESWQKSQVPWDLGPLLAILSFLKRVASLRAEELGLLSKPWEHLGTGFVSVASLALEEQSARASCVAVCQ